MTDALEELKPMLRQHLNTGAAVVFSDKITSLAGFEPPVTDAEMRRFERVMLPDQGRLHALGRGLVRYFLDLPTTDFSQTASLKPQCAEAAFNISHSGSRIAVAFHKTCAVGVDVEIFSRHIRQDGLIDRICHPAEKAWVLKQPADTRDMAFLRCWVRKEAVLKATGTGLIDALWNINTQLHDPLPTITAGDALRIWDFPAFFSDDPGALAVHPSVDRIVLTSLQPFGLIGMGLGQNGAIQQSNFQELRSRRDK